MINAKSDMFLHSAAREVATTLLDPDRKQLRFNDIVETAKLFYPNATLAGVRELTQACDKVSPSYVKRKPMHQSLNHEYGWMVDPRNANPDRWSPRLSKQTEGML